MDELNKKSVVFVPDRSLQHDVTLLFSMTSHGCVRLTALYNTVVRNKTISRLFRNGLSSEMQMQKEKLKNFMVPLCVPNHLGEVLPVCVCGEGGGGFIACS